MPGSSAGPPNPSRCLVLDSWPVMEWLKNRQPVADFFPDLVSLAKLGQVELLMSTINLGEIYYNWWNEWSEARADQTLEVLRALPIMMIHPTEDDALLAPRVKGQHKVSYADAFAAVVALEFNAPGLTGDPDFLKLRAANLIVVQWLGA